MDEDMRAPVNLSVDTGLLEVIYEDIISDLQDTTLEDLVETEDEATTACIIAWLEAHDIYDAADFIMNYARLLKAAEAHWKPMQN